MAVARIARIRHQDLVAGAHHRGGQQLQRRRRAGGHDDAPRRHIRLPALGIPARDRLAQGRQAGRRGVLGATGVDAALRRLGHRRGGGGVGLADVQVDHRLAALGRIAGRAARDEVGGLGALHHPEGLDAGDTRRQPERIGGGAGESVHERWRVSTAGSRRQDQDGRGALRAARWAATSAGRSAAAALSSTPLTYLWPSVPPKALASSTASLIATR